MGFDLSHMSLSARCVTGEQKRHIRSGGEPRSDWVPSWDLQRINVQPFLLDQFRLGELGNNLPAMSIMSMCQVPKRCVVTGGLGFVGQRLVETLVERGAEQVWGPRSWSWAWEPVQKDAKIREKRELQARTKMNQDKQLVSLGGYKMFQPVF